MGARSNTLLKSTLLKLNMSLKKPMKGEFSLGEHNVVSNYLSELGLCHWL